MKPVRVWIKTLKNIGNKRKVSLCKRGEMCINGKIIGKNQSEIVKILNRNKSSISREISRNTNGDGFYLLCDAQDYYRNRRSECHPKKKDENKELFEKVKNLFSNHQWSPEQISARLKTEKKLM